MTDTEYSLSTTQKSHDGQRGWTATELDPVGEDREAWVVRRGQRCDMCSDYGIPFHVITSIIQNDS